MRDTRNLIVEGREPPPASAPAASSSYHCQAKRTGFGDYVACLEPPPITAATLSIWATNIYVSTPTTWSLQREQKHIEMRDLVSPRQ
jgi:hypothetical protein